jgi:uncharacterized protein (DUF1697 family)
MALVVLLRGVNVGGHRTFRPSVLAKELSHLEAVNVGAAGTFVIRRPTGRGHLRAEFARRLPFATEIMICDGSAILRLLSRDFFAGNALRPNVVRFVSVLSRSPRSRPPMPLSIPATGEWLVRVVATEGRFLIGMYRRQMRAIGHLGTLDRVFGAPVTTRNWSTLAAIADVLDDRTTRRRRRPGRR